MSTSRFHDELITETRQPRGRTAALHLAEFNPPAPLPQEPPPPSPDEIFAKFVFDGDEDVSAPKWLVQDMLPEKGVAFIGGQSGAGKTFIVIELARCLATGSSFFDHQIREEVGVAILAGEGAYTITNRLAAAKQRNGISEKLPVTYLGEVPDLTKQEDLSALVAALKLLNKEYGRRYRRRLGVVVMDTLAATFDLDDENDNSEAAKTIRLMKVISEELDCLVVPVHHYGKSAATGLRGGSAWRGGCDALLSVLSDRVEATGEVTKRELWIAKNRDGVEKSVGVFDLPFVQLGVDEDGVPFGTLTVEPRLDMATTFNQSPRQKPKTETVAVRNFRLAFAEAVTNRGKADFRVGRTGPIVRAVLVSDVREEFLKIAATGAEESKQRATASRYFLRAMGALPPQFATENRDGIEWVWQTLSDNSDRSDNGGQSGLSGLRD